MSIRILSTVWSDSPSKGSDLLVLLAIADNSNDEGVAFPSIKTIAKKARLSRRQTQYCIGNLVASGQISVDMCASKYGTNKYTFYFGGGVQEMGAHNMHPCNDDCTPPVQIAAPKPSLNLTMRESCHPTRQKASQPKFAEVL